MGPVRPIVFPFRHGPVSAHVGQLPKRQIRRTGRSRRTQPGVGVDVTNGQETNEVVDETDGSLRTTAGEADGRLC